MFITVPKAQHARGKIFNSHFMERNSRRRDHLCPRVTFFRFPLDSKLTITHFTAHYKVQIKGTKKAL